MFTNNKELKPFKELEYFEIIKSGIDKFPDYKIYIDTSAVSNNNIIDTNFSITYVNRPSRANMQPIPNSIWFAKLKDSPKFIIVKNESKEILNNYIFSTGFMGMKADEFIINYLYLLILSESFNKQKDLSSTGATMMGINNDIFGSILVPNVTKDEAQKFGNEIEPIINELIKIESKNRLYKHIKEVLLNKYFA